MFTMNLLVNKNR